MTRRATLILSALMGLVLVCLLLWAVGPASTNAAAASPPRVETPAGPLSEADLQKAALKMDPALLHALQNAGMADPITAIIRLSGRADLSAAPTLAGRAARAAHAVEALQSFAAAAQADLRDYLAQAERAGDVASYRPYFIFNGIAVTAPAETIWRLALRDDVAGVGEDALWGVDNCQVGSCQLIVDSCLPTGRSDCAQLPTANQQLATEWNLTQIGADAVWSQYGILGEGVVVANVDTGVAYDHPALAGSYAGNLGGGVFDHDYAWYDAVNGAAAPYDDNGHGTHTMGTIAGGDGPGPFADDIGVAPGASWIAVKALNQAGTGYSSALHAAYEWLLAPCPAGVAPGDATCDPAKAPHVVNNSWSNTNPAATEFADDVAALRAVGILPVFSAGNSGPVPGSINSPASNPGAFAVGATDSGDIIAAFSSRGPSPLTDDFKPDVVAPGVDVRSSLPGGTYGMLSGTSMSAPHVAGLAALVLSAAPDLPLPLLEEFIRTTAVDLGPPGPDMDAGYGRIDALAAVARALSSGTLAGAVTDAGTGDPLAGASLQVQGAGLTAVTDSAADGSYAFDYLTAGAYTLTASLYGYEPATVTGVSVITDQVTTQDLALTALPRVVISGHVVRVLSPTLPITNATVAVLDAPLPAAGTDNNGFYSLTVPAGPVVLEATAVGYATHLEALTVLTDTAVDFALDALPPVLLVDDDEGALRSYSPHVEPAYFSALDSNGYNYTYWDIEALGAPDYDVLRQYLAVIWFGGEFGRIKDISDAAQADAVMAYLDGGGQLLYVAQEHTSYSGDDAACDSPTWGGEGPCPFTRDYLGILDWIEDQKASQVFGVPGHPIGDGFAVIDMSYPPQFTDFTDSITDTLPAASTAFTGTDYTYPGERSFVAHTLISSTAGFKTAFFATPLEAMSLVDGADVMFAAMEWFGVAGLAEGVTLAPGRQVGLAPAGESVTFTLRLRNLGEAPDTFDLTVLESLWETTIWDAGFATQIETLGPVPPGETADFGVAIAIPAGTPGGAEDTARVAVTSQSGTPYSDEASLTAKALMTYYALDSDVCGSGVSFAWVDATGGDRWDLDDGDFSLPDYVSVDLPAPFIFYNEHYDHVWINDHGTVLFGDDNLYNDGTPSGEPPIPNTTLLDPNGAIYAAWGNLYWHPGDQDPSSAVYTHHETGQGRNWFVIEYHKYENLFGDKDTFEVILDLDTNDVMVQYQTMTHVSFTVVGIENQAGTQGILYVNDLQPPPNTIHNALAVRFGVGTPPPVTQVEVLPAASTGSGLPGEVVTYTLSVFNRGDSADSYDLELLGNQWPAALFDAGFGAPLAEIGPVGSCQQVAFGVQVTLPANPGVPFDTTQVRARSQSNPLVAGYATITTTNAGPGVNMSPAQTALALPGQTISYTLAVTNTGAVNDQYALALSGYAWPTAFTPPITETAPLSPGEAQAVIVSVTVPATATVGAVDTAGVTATSQGHPGIFVSTTLRTEVLDTPAATLPQGLGQVGMPGESVTYTLSLQNTSASTYTYAVAVAGSWETAFSPPLSETLPLPPGEAQALQVVVTVPEDALAGAEDVALVEVTTPIAPAFLVTTTLTTEAAAVPALGALADQAGSAVPGQTVVLQVPVTNAGNITDTYDLALAGFSWETSLNASTAALAPGATELMNVTVAVPPGTPAGSTETGALSVSSQAYPAISGTAQLTASAAALAAITVSDDLSDGTLPGGVVVYAVTVTNAGNVTDTFALSLSPATWETVFGAPYAGTAAVLEDMAIGESRVVHVLVTVSPAAELGVSDQVTLSVSSTVDDGVVASLTLTTTAMSGAYRVLLPLVTRQ